MGKFVHNVLLSAIFLHFFVFCVQSQIKRNTKDDDYPSKEEWYPEYHLAPPSGWMNDPNGLIAFEGYYHVFYQHNPYAPVTYAANISWGHARSKDMIHWEHLPVAISPSIKEDENGCFSGSAVNDGGVMTLIYTGNSVDENGVQVEVQCIATSNDTIHFTKHGEVLGPPDNNPDFRDPKVWREGDSWYMVLGLRNESTGEVLLYESKDLHQWEYVRVLARANDKLGYMWECPDFFPLGGKYVLTFSPQGVKPDGYLYRNYDQSGYFVGDWRPGSGFHILQNFTITDYGHDFYAQQTFLAPDGRRILIAWLDMWNSSMPEDKQDWAGSLTLPRELSLSDDNKLLVRPIREIKTLRQRAAHINETVLNNQFLELDDNVTTLEIITTWNLTASDAERYGLWFGGSYPGAGLSLHVDNQSNRLLLDRCYSEYGLCGYRSISLEGVNILTLNVFFDHSSVEVFINNGVACMTSRIYPKKNERSLSLFAENGLATLKSSSRWLLKAS